MFGIVYCVLYVYYNYDYRHRHVPLKNKPTRKQLSLKSEVYLCFVWYGVRYSAFDIQLRVLLYCISVT